MKVAIVHDWLTAYGGAERVIEDWLAIWPEATVFTLVYDKKHMPKRFENYHIVTTYVQKFPRATKWYKKYLSFMPKAFESLDLSGYDVVISSSSCCAKGVLSPVTAPHICYCHTPTRYVWDMYYEYRRHAGLLTRLCMPGMIHKVREWDYLAAQRVDFFTCNSNFINKRIRKYYHRDALTIYPGVRMNPNPVVESDDFYLCVSRFTYYKRLDLAVAACTKLGKKLVVVGGGEEEKHLRKIAGPTVEFKGRLSDEEVFALMPHAKAFLFPGEEDFGSTPVEAQSSGVPVLAYGRGGILETVREGDTGLFFREQTVDAVCACIGQFEKQGVTYSRQQIHDYARKFSQEVYRPKFKAYVEKCVEDWKNLQPEVLE